MHSLEPTICGKCSTPLPLDAPRGLCPQCLVAMNLAEDTALTSGVEAAAQPPLAPEQIAAHFPQLEVLECLGRGGMGVVYKARQKSLGRLVALKLLAPEREKDPQFAERFAREAQALAQLDHPHIVTVYDFGQTNGFFYLLMEFVDGVNLRQLLRSRKLTPEEALAIVPPLCEALQFAHERGIVHRDIKPENLLLAKGGRVKIADFGIAMMLGDEAQIAEEKAVGTPGYMAPEQMETPPRVDSRADIFSLGVVFYEMLTGELPAQKLVAPSRKVQVDVRIDEIVLRALEAKPEMRFQTAADLRTQIKILASSPPELSPSTENLLKAKGVSGLAETDAVNPWPNRIIWLLLLSVPLALFAVIFVLPKIAHERELAWNPAVQWMQVVALLVFATSLIMGVWMRRRYAGQAGKLPSWLELVLPSAWRTLALAVIPTVLLIVAVNIPRSGGTASPALQAAPQQFAVREEFQKQVHETELDVAIEQLYTTLTDFLQVQKEDALLSAEIELPAPVRVQRRNALRVELDSLTKRRAELAERINSLLETKAVTPNSSNP